MPAEPKALYSEPEPPRLNRFRVAIERKDNKAFDEALQENPRFILNTTVDGPTILQGAQRHNVMHVSCSAGNLYALNATLEALASSRFLLNAYGTLNDIDTLYDHLLDTFLNTPDKNANNTPLHFACKNGHLDIVKKLMSFGVCRRDPVNRWHIRLIYHIFMFLDLKKHHSIFSVKLLKVRRKRKHVFRLRSESFFLAFLHQKRLNFHVS